MSDLLLFYPHYDEYIDTFRISWTIFPKPSYDGMVESSELGSHRTQECLKNQLGSQDTPLMLPDCLRCLEHSWWDALSEFSGLMQHATRPSAPEQSLPNQWPNFSSMVATAYQPLRVLTAELSRVSERLLESIGSSLVVPCCQIHHLILTITSQEDWMVMSIQLRWARK